MSGAVEGAEEVRRFRPYPEYTKTGLSWLPEVPQHWRVTRLKNACSVRPSNVDKNTLEGELPVRLCNYTDVYYNDRISSERDFMLASATAEEIRKFTLAAGDVLITKDSETADDIAIPAYVEKDLEGVLCGYHLAHIRPEPSSLIGAFVAHGFVADVVHDQFRIAANGITRFGLSLASIANSVFPAPPLDEQRAIAEFLDRETGKIDALVAKKERLIELLQEKHTALIERLVSGTEGFPAVRLGYYVDLLPGFAFPSAGFSSDDDDVRLLRGVNVSPGSIRWDETVYWPGSHAHSFAAYELHPGDLVFGMDRPWIGRGIRVAEVQDADCPALLLQRVARLRAKNGLDQRFLHLLLSSPQFSAYFEPILTGISVPHVSPQTSPFGPSIFPLIH